MRNPWASRAAETFAVLTIGNATMELVSPRGRSLPWETGPEGNRKVARFFAENPNLMRLPGAARPAIGLWLALRQYRGR